MNSYNEKVILQIIKYTPPIFIITLSIIISISLYYNYKETLKEEKHFIQYEYVNSNKNLIKGQVDLVYESIRQQQMSTKKNLKQLLKNRVYEAYNIANNIYKENKHLGKEVVKKMIVDALKPIRFNNGRGYFFIYSFDYECILLPINDKLEGTNFYNFKDEKGSFLTRDIIEILKEKKEDFLTWWYYKPSDLNKQYEKLGFNKHFEPYDWFIGTGEYIDDFEQDTKTKVIKKIKSLKYPNNGYVFAMDHKGNYLSHIRDEIIGLNALEAKDTRTHQTIIDAINLSKTKGTGYISYIQNRKPGSNLPVKKTSYIKNIQNWDFFIGKGFYEDDTNELIKKEEELLNRRLKENLNQIMVITVLLTIVLLLISLKISKILERKFQQYKEEIHLNNDEISKQQSILAQQSKMASLGNMIGNIAHQWRQPLSLISTAATGMQIKKELGSLEDKELVDTLGQINGATQYLSKTIDDFRNFFASNKEREDFSIQNTLNKSLSLVDAQFKNHDITIINNIGNSVIYGVETELVQVFINILNNSRDELINKEDEKKLIIIDSKEKNELLTITIKDNAGGISPEILEKVFEPYFTTKGQSQGTGIGLYMSREIVIKHLDGDIQMKNCQFEHQGVTYKGVQINMTFPLVN